MVYLPVEYVGSGFQCYCSFNSLLEIPSIQVYVVRSSATNESLEEKLNQLLQQVNSIEELQTFDTITDLLQFTVQALVAISTGNPLPLLPVIPSLPLLPSPRPVLTPATISQSKLLLF